MLINDKLKPFSKRYSDYFSRCRTNQINGLEGAYRAGKTVINIFAFANYLEFSRDKIHLVSGVSVSTARLNISDCNGLGLSYIFEGRSRIGKYEGNDCLRINTSTGEKIVIFAGGGKADSYKRIQGLSFGSWLSVEFANLYISDDEQCFISMAISRLTQSSDRKIWFDLNPIYPKHRVYTKFLDVWEKESPFGGYNFMRCSLYDNTALTSEQIESFVSLYPDVNSVEHRRHIKGERAASEGFIFTNFANDSKPWVVNDIGEFLKGRTPQFISIGIDFGGNKSSTVFTASLLYSNYSGVLVVASKKVDMTSSESDSNRYKKEFKDFIETVRAMDIAPVRVCYCDNADTVKIRDTQTSIRENSLGGIKVHGCSKHTILKRIDAKKMLMGGNRWFVLNGVSNVIESTATQVWNPKAEDERLDDGTVDIDTADSEEYSWSAFLDRLIAVRRR